MYDETLIGIQVPFITAFLSGILIIIVALTSNRHRAPKYHWVFGIMNFIASVVVIFGFSAEIISLLTTMSIILESSGSVMGVTVLALGKGIGDAVNNIILAKQNYQRMAFSACFGGAIFSKSTVKHWRHL